MYKLIPNRSDKTTSCPPQKSIKNLYSRSWPYQQELLLACGPLSKHGQTSIFWPEGRKCKCVVGVWELNWTSSDPLSSHFFFFIPTNCDNGQNFGKSVPKFSVSCSLRVLYSLPPILFLLSSSSSSALVACARGVAQRNERLLGG